MQEQLDRIEKGLDKVGSRLDAIESKLEVRLERLARVEASQGWIKWSLTFLASAIGAIAMALSKLKL